MAEGKPLKIPIRAAESVDEETKLLISTAELKKLIDDGADFALIDVRSETEYSVLHIEGAKLATRELVEEIFASWDKSRRLVICDHLGKESKNAAKALQSRGFEDARALAGGLDAWSQTVDPLFPRY
jgi:rhodanese-related sulfurtransferase